MPSHYIRSIIILSENCAYLNAYVRIILSNTPFVECADLTLLWVNMALSLQCDRVKQKSIGSVSPHAWQLPVLLNLWLTVIATALAIALHKRTENGTCEFNTLFCAFCELEFISEERKSHTNSN